MPLRAAADKAVADVIQHGEYVFRAAGCAGCHTDEEQGGPALAGGAALKTPFGVFYAPNITPDAEFGIGRWSDADFIKALRLGVSPKGDHYYPAFPYTSYTRLTDQDLLALKAFLFTAPPIAEPSRPHELPWYARFRPLLKIWKMFFFTPGAFQSHPDKSSQWNRGAYLALAAVHCGECHTPRNAFGGFEEKRYLAGTRNGPGGTVVPNITPDKKTGTGRWSQGDLVTYLETGGTPDGDFAGDLMAEVIDNSLSFLTKEDIIAIATYVRSVPAIENSVRREKKKDKKGEFDF